MITFSSDEELIEALGSITGDVFRLYVRVDENTKRDETFRGEQFAQVFGTSLKQKKTASLTFHHDFSVKFRILP